jgi:hypothetical protein
LELNLLVLDCLACELDLQIEINCGGGGFGQASAHSYDGKFGAARHLKHVKIAVTVTRIERFHGHGDQEVALTIVANALTFRRMADAIDLMQGVGYMIGKSALLKHPLAIRSGKGGE